jgi:hypothetical protein
VVRHGNTMTGSGPGRLDLSHLRTKNPARHLSFASGSRWCI